MIAAAHTVTVRPAAALSARRLSGRPLLMK